MNRYGRPSRLPEVLFNVCFFLLAVGCVLLFLIAAYRGIQLVLS